MSKPQCPKCIGGALRSTVRKITSVPYKDLSYDNVDRMLSEVCNTVAGYIELAEAYVLAAKTKQGETHGTAKCREGRRRHLFQGGMTPEKPQCTECIGGDLRKGIYGICSGSYRRLGCSSIDHMLDEIYRKMARYLELAEKFAFITSAWQAQSVTCSSALCLGWKRKTWERYVGKSRDAGLGWLARQGLITKGQRGMWMWAPGVTLEKVLAADAELRAFAETRREWYRGKYGKEGQDEYNRFDG